MHLCSEIFINMHIQYIHKYYWVVILNLLTIMRAEKPTFVAASHAVVRVIKGSCSEKGDTKIMWKVVTVPRCSMRQHTPCFKILILPSSWKHLIWLSSYVAYETFYKFLGWNILKFYSLYPLFWSLWKHLHIRILNTRVYSAALKWHETMSSKIPRNTEYTRPTDWRRVHALSSGNLLKWLLMKNN